MKLWNWNDALSRPVSRTGGMGVSPVQDAFGYNARDELVSASKTVGRDAPIAPPGGSQSPATAYTANNLNQYSSISTSDFRLQTSRLNLTMMYCYGVRPRSKVEKQLLNCEIPRSLFPQFPCSPQFGNIVAIIEPF